MLRLPLVHRRRHRGRRAGRQRASLALWLRARRPEHDGRLPAVEDEGKQVGSYHSHPRSPAEPSQTDINLATNWPDWLYVIVSLDGEPTVRAWWLRDGNVEEQRLEIV